MNKKLFVSFSYINYENNTKFCNGVINFKEPESFEDIQNLSNKIIETAKEQNMNIKNVIILFWKVLKEKGEDKNGKQNKKNERIGYFS